MLSSLVTLVVVFAPFFAFYAMKTAQDKAERVNALAACVCFIASFVLTGIGIALHTPTYFGSFLFVLGVVGVIAVAGLKLAKRLKWRKK